MKTKFNIFDALLAAAVVFAAVLFFAVSGKLRKPDPGGVLYARVIADNKTVMTLPLSGPPREISVTEGLSLYIEDSSVRVSSADCPKKICRHYGRISRPGETLVCAPRKIAVVIEEIADGVSAAREDYDAVAR